MYKAKEEFLWYKIGDDIKEDEAQCIKWEAEGLVELSKPIKSEKKEEPEAPKKAAKKSAKK